MSGLHMNVEKPSKQLHKPKASLETASYATTENAPGTAMRALGRSSSRDGLFSVFLHLECLVMKTHFYTVAL